MTTMGWKRGLVTAGAMLLGLAVATSSWAQASVQGLYYREFQKDGRYFVFNNPKAADAFEKQLATLRTLLDTDLRALEIAMEKAGAPWTPGRLPIWVKE